MDIGVVSTFLVIVNNTTMNLCIQAFVWTYVFILIAVSCCGFNLLFHEALLTHPIEALPPHRMWGSQRLFSCDHLELRPSALGPLAIYPVQTLCWKFFSSGSTLGWSPFYLKSLCGIYKEGFFFNRHVKDKEWRHDTCVPTTPLKK